MDNKSNRLSSEEQDSSISFVGCYFTQDVTQISVYTAGLDRTVYRSTFWRLLGPSSEPYIYAVRHALAASKSKKRLTDTEKFSAAKVTWEEQLEELGKDKVSFRKIPFISISERLRGDPNMINLILSRLGISKNLYIEVYGILPNEHNAFSKQKEKITLPRNCSDQELYGAIEQIRNKFS